MSPIPAPTDTVQRCDTLSRSLTSILVSRFLLNLQAVDQQSTGTVSSIGSQVESVVFQRVVGSFGGNIEFGRDTVPNDYDHDGAAWYCQVNVIKGIGGFVASGVRKGEVSTDGYVTHFEQIIR